jgi:hypothetical protein
MKSLGIRDERNGTHLALEAISRKDGMAARSKEIAFGGYAGRSDSRSGAATDRTHGTYGTNVTIPSILSATQMLGTSLLAPKVITDYFGASPTAHLGISSPQYPPAPPGVFSSPSAGAMPS